MLRRISLIRQQTIAIGRAAAEEVERLAFRPALTMPRPSLRITHRQLLHGNSGFPEIRDSSTLFTGIRNLGEAPQIFRIPVNSVREFRIPVETTAIPDSGTQLHCYPGFQ